MALLPLLGALVMSQGSPAPVMIQSQIYAGDRITINGKSGSKVTVRNGLTIVEGADVKEVLKSNKLEKLFSPTIVTNEGAPAEARLEGGPQKLFSVKYTADKDSSSSVVLHADLDLGGITAKTDFTAIFGQTYVLVTKSKPGRVIFIKVDRPAA